MIEITYRAVRLTYDSNLDFNEPGRASTNVSRRSKMPPASNWSWAWPRGPRWRRRWTPEWVQPASSPCHGLDQGALLSLEGEPLEATLYLVGNPILAREVTRHEPGAALYAPFRVAVYRDPTGVHIAYDKPSSVFASLGSSGIDVIAVALDDKIRTVVESSCR
jgi:hypothetical protein